MVLGLAAPASATPLADKRAEAARIKAQVDELDERLEIAAEEYNEAREQYEAVTADVQANEALAAELEARQATLETHLSTRVVSMYRQGPLGALEVLLGATSFEEFATMWDVLQTLNGRDAVQMAELRETRMELERVHAELAAQQVEAKAHADVMERQRVEVEGQLAERERLLAGVEDEIAELVREAEEAARRRAAAAAAAARPATDYGNPTNAPRSSVVAIAMSKLGAPYKWAASGPDMFDCSGFTMWCYAQIGVSLPHSSRAQINVGQRVSKANLEPGDLVFFGRSTIHHVGIYVGNGNYVHAPSTGDVVKVSSLGARSDYVGACRP
jgi:cell wall-associated NlpC family hydrolase